jgi:hypothetical protein
MDFDPRWSDDPRDRDHSSRDRSRWEEDGRELDQGSRGGLGITADTALRLARYFAMTPLFWMNLQIAYDLDLATRASREKIERDVQPRKGT